MNKFMINQPSFKKIIKPFGVYKISKSSKRLALGATVQCS